MHAQLRLSHLCSELASFQVSLNECPRIVSQNGLLSAKTSACCFSSCQQHCTIFGNLLKNPLNLTCGSFLELLKWKLIQNVVVFKLASVFFHKFPKWGHTHDFKEYVIQADLMPHPNCPLASLQIKGSIVTINSISPSVISMTS